MCDSRQPLFSLNSRVYLSANFAKNTNQLVKLDYILAEWHLLLFRSRYVKNEKATTKSSS